MTKAIVKSTQVAVILSLNIVTQADNSSRLYALPLVPVTTFFFVLWAIRETVNREWSGLANLSAAWLDLCQALAMGAAVYLLWASVITKALAYGMGIKL